MNPLIKQLKQFGPLSTDCESELNEKTIIQDYNRGDFFVKEGQLGQGLFVIEKGVVRSFHYKNGREITDWFGFENTPLGASTSLFFNQSSLQNIQFLEYSTIHLVLNSDLTHLYSKYVELNNIGKRITETWCHIVEDRLRSLQTDSAEQRYQHLLKLEPYLLQRVPLGDIASYLGITQETLSRIRRRII